MPVLKRWKVAKIGDLIIAYNTGKRLYNLK
jgi:hypothetical protein